MKLFRFGLFFLLFPCYIVQAQSTTEDYIAQWYKKAVEEMWSYGIPASITLAQGIIESGSGKSPLATQANNHFGIKCHKEWSGETFIQDDDAEDECFRKYRDAGESFDDHSKFLKTRDRYAFLFNYERTDYKSWAQGLKEAGYATNPKYTELLTGTVERYGLSKYDNMSLADIGMESPKPLASTKPVEEAPKPVHQSELAEQIDEAVQIHDIFYINRIKTIKAREGDRPLEIAVRYGIPLKLLMRWNDMTDERQIPKGQNIFLQPKRKRAPGKDHIAKRGESMYDISQMYGIRLESLYERNWMQGNEQPALGVNIILNGSRMDKPQTRTYGDVLKEKTEIEKKNLESQSQTVYLEQKEKNPEVFVQHIYVKAEEDNENATTQVSVIYNGEKTPVTEQAKEKINPVIPSGNAGVSLPEEQPVSKTKAINTSVYLPESIQLKEPEKEKAVLVQPEKVQEPVKPVIKESIPVEKITEQTIVQKESAAPEKVVVKESPAVIKTEAAVEKAVVAEEKKWVKEEDIPVTASVTVNSKTEIPTQQKGTIKYTVQRGDTLYNVSKRFNTTVENLKIWNSLLDNSIRIGQELTVSQ